MNALNFAIIVLLLAFAGFLAGTEASLNSISRIAVEELVSSKKRGSAWLFKVTSNRTKYLNVVLLVRKACELAATAIVARFS
jgi:CBS domain containing-hemolysin-like protein